MGPLPTTPRGYKYLLTARDVFSRWLEAYPTKDQTAQTVVNRLTQELFPRYGYPEQIRSDQGSAFTSALFKEVAGSLNIECVTTPAYNPRSNPVERSHRDLKPMLRAMCRGNIHEWDRALPQALFALRTSVNSSTGVSPFALIFGRDPSQALEVRVPPPESQEEALTRGGELAYTLRENARLLHCYMREHLQSTITLMRRRYHRERKSFTPGVKVWLFTPPKDSRTMGQWWRGPYIVLKQLNDLCYSVIPASPEVGPSVEKVVSIDRMKLYGTGGQQGDDARVERAPARGQEADPAEGMESWHYGPGGPPGRGPQGGGGGGGGGGRRSRRRTEDDDDDEDGDEGGPVFWRPWTAGSGLPTRRRARPRDPPETRAAARPPPADPSTSTPSAPTSPPPPPPEPLDSGESSFITPRSPVSPPGSAGSTPSSAYQEADLPEEEEEEGAGALPEEDPGSELDSPPANQTPARSTYSHPRLFRQARRALDEWAHEQASRLRSPNQRPRRERRRPQRIGDEDFWWDYTGRDDRRVGLRRALSPGHPSPAGASSPLLVVEEAEQEYEEDF